MEQSTRTPPPVPAAADRASARLRALSGFLRADPSRLLPLAAHLRDLDAEFESTIRGPSMEPAIPRYSSLRVRLLDEQPCQPGDVLYFLADDGDYVVHRVVYRTTRGGAERVLTYGDACVAPDRPIHSAQVLGIVVAVETARGWAAPGPVAPLQPLYKRPLRAAGYAVMVAALTASPPAAVWLADWLRRAETLGRRVARRVRGGPPRRPPAP